ncbi:MULTISPECIES: hypothetical protein [unclassified Streptomyces]|uniref:hypothetical protein n=1 Tax=unclassified Streptomyces TaxID=2593676 RepID=UPI003438ED56
MSSRVLMPLRAWSAALLLCALMFCLAGLARPAMEMSSATAPSASMVSMASMEMAAPTQVSSDASGVVRADAVEYGAQCPMAGTPCATQQATLVQQDQTSVAPIGLPAGAPCFRAAGVAQPNAPPVALPPPDLHRLCVSRT